VLDQILFEISMAFSGLIAYPQAILLAEGGAVLASVYSLAFFLSGYRVSSPESAF